MTSLLRIKYSPLFISELEDTYDDIINLINNRINFCVYGSIGVGKTTIILTILKEMNIDYIYIYTYNKTLDEILRVVNRKTIMSYFNNCHSIIIFDNFDDSLYKNIEQHCIFINNKPIKSLKSIMIDSPSIDYLQNLMESILSLEDSECIGINTFDNYHVFFSELECAISTQKSIRCEYEFKPDKNIHRKLYDRSLSLHEKIKIAEKVEDYSTFQTSYLTGVTSLENAVKASESISSSTNMERTGYYPILGLVIPSLYIDSPVKEYHIKQNYNNKRLIKRKYSLDEILWNPFKKIK